MARRSKPQSRAVRSRVLDPAITSSTTVEEALAFVNARPQDASSIEYGRAYSIIRMAGRVDDVANPFIRGHIMRR